MTEEITPKFISLKFHTRFFPGLLRERLRPREKKGTTFVSSGFMEGMIGLAVSMLLVALGVPSVVARGSIFGWIMTILGVGGIIALVASSVYFQWGNRPSYENFQIGIFFFFMVLGLSSGIYAGFDKHSLLLGITAGTAGLIAGYGTGIFAGLWMQYLGWTVSVVNMMAGSAAFIMAGTDVVMIFLWKR